MKRRLLLAIAVLAPTLTVSKVKGDTDDVQVRWDIVHISDFSLPVLNAGGQASARAEDNSKLTVTGTGTFKPWDPNGVTGGGTWQTFDASGASTGSGMYLVTGLIKFSVAPGSLPTTAVDNIGNAANAHSGLVFLHIRYSDGSRGVLVISCHLPVGSSVSTFEGITVSKGFVDYWNHDLAVAGVDANRNVFHITQGND
jgi:hypothetical protein